MDYPQPCTGPVTVKTGFGGTVNLLVIYLSRSVDSKSPINLLGFLSRVVWTEQSVSKHEKHSEPLAPNSSRDQQPTRTDTETSTPQTQPVAASASWHRW